METEFSLPELTKHIPGDATGYQPVTGDWDGNGRTEIGTYNPTLGAWYLDFNGDGIFTSGTDKAYTWGATGYQSVVGDWNGNGRTEIGTYNPTLGVWYLDYNGDGVFTPGTDKAYTWGCHRVSAGNRRLERKRQDRDRDV